MIIHYIALPIAGIFGILLIRDLMRNKKEHLISRTAIIVGCLAAYFVSGLAIDWIKDEYTKSRPNYVRSDKSPSTTIQNNTIK